MTPEDDVWAQTLITITPEEDATLREISDTVTLSSAPETPLVLNADKIVYRRSFTRRQFVDLEEGETEEDVERKESVKILKKDAENQTYLQGTPIVQISVEYKDDASQTMYMNSPCPPLTYFKDILTSMNEVPVPTLKTSNTTSTIISFRPKTPQHVVMEQLSMDVTEQQLEEFISKFTDDHEQADMEVSDILRFLLARSFWIFDPISRAQAETTDKEAQTSIKYNYLTKTFVVDMRIQTELTCEPKKSNTKLLSEYWETKSMILKCLDDCFSKGIETRIIIDDLINEMIDKCADKIRYPLKDQIMQTIATYKFLGEKEEDVLRKLRLDVIVDPFEASIIVVPLMDHLLVLVCNTVSRNAFKSVRNILEVIFQRTITILVKLMELQKETKPKPLEEILAQRRKKILESMSRKETETISTQTSIAGIFEVKRVKESKEVVCSVCRQQSVCKYCTTNWENGDAPQEFQMRRTQDILLAYKPCYIVTRASQKEKNLEQARPLDRKPATRTPSLDFTNDPTKTSSETISVLLQPENRVKPKQSINEWSYVVEATLMKPCSVKESMSQVTVTSSTKSTSKSCHGGVASDAAHALQILKQTFCTQENCVASTPSKDNSLFCDSDSDYITSTSVSRCGINNGTFEQDFCAQQKCKAFSKLHLPETKPYRECLQVPLKSRGDGFKIIPICMSQNSDT